MSRRIGHFFSILFFDWMFRHFYLLRSGHVEKAEWKKWNELWRHLFRTTFLRCCSFSFPPSLLSQFRPSVSTTSKFTQQTGRTRSFFFLSIKFITQRRHETTQWFMVEKILLIRGEMTDESQTAMPGELLGRETFLLWYSCCWCAMRIFVSLQEFFENPAFRPDGLKLYPTLVIRGTGLYELWKTGRYKSYTPSALVDLVARILALVPPWTRVYRVQR